MSVGMGLATHLNVSLHRDPNANFSTPSSSSSSPTTFLSETSSLESATSVSASGSADPIDVYIRAQWSAVNQCSVQLKGQQKTTILDWPEKRWKLTVVRMGNESSAGERVFLVGVQRDGNRLAEALLTRLLASLCQGMYNLWPKESPLVCFLSQERLNALRNID